MSHSRKLCAKIRMRDIKATVVGRRVRISRTVLTVIIQALRLLSEIGKSGGKRTVKLDDMAVERLLLDIVEHDPGYAVD